MTPVVIRLYRQKHFQIFLETRGIISPSTMRSREQYCACRKLYVVTALDLFKPQKSATVSSVPPRRMCISSLAHLSADHKFC